MSQSAKNSLDVNSKVTAQTEKPLYVIRAGGVTDLFGGVFEALRYRDLLGYLLLRDVKLRYRQTFFGVFWTILQPVIASGIFTIFFGKFAKIPSENIPYSLFCMAALLPWNYFSSAVVRASYSISGNSGMIAKIYLPRLVFPLSAILPGLLDLALCFCIYTLVLTAVGYHPSFFGMAQILFGFFGLTCFAFGLGLILSAVNVRFRDVGNVLPFLMQLWMFATPVIYSSSAIPEKYKWLNTINPATPFISLVRAGCFSTDVDVIALCKAFGIVVITVVFGVTYFRKAESTFADFI